MTFSQTIWQLWFRSFKAHLPSESPGDEEGGGGVEEVAKGVHQAPHPHSSLLGRLDLKYVLLVTLLERRQKLEADRTSVTEVQKHRIS